MIKKVTILLALVTFFTAHALAAS
ncbi:MAG: hypothetical protein H6Q69_3813, partial [Firmicutes bacterium]|nr:hypothetical protein [Bacillota bacterium]